jgi:hypothetical protein
MAIMLAFLPLIGGLFGLKGRAAGIVGGIVTLLGALLIVWGGWSLIKGRIIKTHDLEQELGIAKQKGEADSTAGDERSTDVTRVRRETDELKETVDEASSEGRDPRAAYYACVQLQQSARAANKPVPSC